MSFHLPDEYQALLDQIDVLDETKGEVPYLRATAAEWVSKDPFPGLVKVELVDAYGRTWLFVDKAPMFDPDQALLPTSSYPVPIDLACTVVSDDGVVTNNVLLVSTGERWLQGNGY